MKLVVGLGNPGAEYERTRHNAGWLVVDALARRHAPGAIARSRFNAATLDASFAGEKALLMKPLTFMNRSGQSVGEAVRFFKLEPAEDVLVLVDDVALPVGHVRVRGSGGTGGHNGLADIDRVLGGASYPRVRIGVGAVPRLMNQADWVLSRFMSEEKADVEQGVSLAADAVECCLARGVTAAMNEFNKRLAEEPPPEHPNELKQKTNTHTAPDAGPNGPETTR
ncbi:MAG: peptidyl-tRNA hydrolase [Phycisphaeraceae bacterium]|nr:MAG: peptidyl-tRNA hydrolase [Phycisphaeraceae bacterium]